MPHRRSERQLKSARIVHFLAETEQHRAGALLGTVLRNQAAPLRDDGGNVCEGLDVVDDSRFAEQTGCCGVWRLLTGFRRFAFEYFENRRIFACNIDGRRPVDRQFQAIQVSCRAGVMNRLFKTVVGSLSRFRSGRERLPPRESRAPPESYPRERGAGDVR